MSTQAMFKEKLDKILFLEIDKNALNKIFNIEIKEAIYLPIQSLKVINEIKKNSSLEKLNFGDFIEGMFYVMGCDPLFNLSYIYADILKSNDNICKNVIRKAIYERIQGDNLLDAYIMLKGLAVIENSEDVYSKLLLLSDTLRKKNSNFKEEEIKVIERAKSLGFFLAYYYESIMYFDDLDYEKAKLSLNEYFILGGSSSKEIREYEYNLEYMLNYKQGKELVYENPKEALKKLLALVDETNEDAVLYYYIAVAYRIIYNYEKAIYYLNEAVRIDSEFIDVINEFGLNYACLGEYNNAILYFKKAFEASQAVEICTNIIMCYISINDIEKAKEYLDIGKKLNKEDEVLREIEEKLKGEGKWN